VISIVGAMTAYKPEWGVLFALWCFGAFGRAAVGIIHSGRFALLSTSAVLVGSSAFTSSQPLKILISFAVAYTLLIGRAEPSDRILTPSAHRWLTVISAAGYQIYAFHFPIGLFSVALVKAFLLPGIVGFGLALALSASMIAFMIIVDKGVHRLVNRIAVR
jgi:hypothetical protein